MEIDEVNKLVKDAYQRVWYNVWQQVDRTYQADFQTIPVKMERIETLSEDDQYGELPYFFYCDYTKERNRIYRLRYIDKNAEQQIITL